MQDPDFQTLLVKMYGEDKVGFKQVSETDTRGIWVKDLSHYPITRESILYDNKFIADLETWLVKNFVLYYTPRASENEWRISFQMFPPGKIKKSYFDVKHDGTTKGILKAKFQGAITLSTMLSVKGEDNDV